METKYTQKYSKTSELGIFDERNLVAYNTFMYSVEKVFGDIRKKGKRLTRARKAIIKMLLSSHALLTAPEINANLKKAGISVNKTSVYRELEFLLQNKIVQAVNISSDVAHYESALHPHHHHITCKSCGQIKDVGTEELDSSMQKLEKRIESLGFEVSDHSLEFFGLCPDCK